MLASAYLCSPCTRSIRAPGVPVRAQQAPAMAVCRGCATCHGGPCKPCQKEGGPVSHGPIMEGTRPFGETVGEMVDRIIGEVAREWVEETTGLKK